LKDDLEFTDAVDCMVSYFYKASYDPTEYDTPEPLLHAQVVTIADKYDCASLNKLATKSFANAVKTVKGDDWAAIATVVYEHTTTDVLAHVELRGLVVAAFAGRYSVLRSTMRNTNIVELLRSNADLATDLLLRGLPENIHGQHIFLCSGCRYVHVGSSECPSVVSQNRLGIGRLCPKCGKESGATSKRFTYKVDLCQAFSCPSCNGTHTLDPGLEFGPEPAPTSWDLWVLNGSVRQTLPGDTGG
jgi:hypothetical protein